MSTRTLTENLLNQCRRAEIRRVVVDSREVQPGDLFLALPGARVDGHHFLGEVAAKGVCQAVVRSDYNGQTYGLILHRVENTLSFLQEWAALRFRELTGTVVGITGSYGKTTTKHFAQTLLSTRYRVWITPGNQNSQIGLPLALLNLRSDPEIVVLEMAMTGAGQIAHLVQLFPPSIAIVTAVTYAHAENFRSLADIARAKAEILGSSRIQMAILSRGLPGELLELVRCPYVTASVEDPEAHLFAILKERELTLFEKGRSIGTLPWLLPALHHCQNFLLAAALARELNLEWPEILAGVPALNPVAGRYVVERLENLDVTVIDDCYNANEVSMCAALDSMPAPKGQGRRIAIFGEIPELGIHADAAHKRVARHALKRADLFVCIGEKTRPMADLWLRAGRAAGWCADVPDAVQALRRLMKPGDVILVKGARCACLETLIERLRLL